VKLTAKVKLEGGDKHALLRTLEAANECADWISEQAWHAKTFAPYSIHKVTYPEAERAMMHRKVFRFRMKPNSQQREFAGADGWIPPLRVELGAGTAQRSLPGDGQRVARCGAFGQAHGVEAAP
jgi:hypothetical protein